MIRNFFVLLFLIAAASAFTFYADKAVPVEERAKIFSTQNDHQAAPSFTFEDMKNKKHSLHDFKDKVIVLNFWASWCAPCVIEFPQMLKLARNSPESIFIFLSVDEDRAAIGKFLKKHKVLPKNVLIGWDRDKKISQNLFLTTKVPETFLIAPDLVIHEKIVGDSVLWNSPEMRQKLSAMADFTDP